MQITHNIPTIKTTKTSVFQPAALLSKAFRSLVQAARRRNNRRKMKVMLELSPHLLKDIGLSRTDVIDAIGSARSENPVEILNARRAERMAGMGHRNYWV